MAKETTKKVKIVPTGEKSSDKTAKDLGKKFEEGREKANPFKKSK